MEFTRNLKKGTSGNEIIFAVRFRTHVLQQKNNGGKTMKKITTILIALLMLALPAVALADTGGSVDITVADILIENAVNIAAAFFIALIGVFGAWLTAKLGKATQLDTVNRAQQELIKLAQITVGELKQTVVDGMKVAHEDGKLTKEEIVQLGQLLYENTTAKLSASAMDVLTAAQVDISALITGTAEHLIGQMKAD